MTPQEVKEVVDDFASWSGNAYTLAMLVYRRQQDDDAVKAEAAGQPDLAEQIRAG